MKCSLLFRTKLIFSIALAIGLSNNLYAQLVANRNAATLTNDDCSKAILLKTKLVSTYSEFSMVGAGRSVNKYRSICEQPNELQQAVWFKSFIPSSGKLNVYLQCDNEMPRVTVFYGECEKLKYLACDASINISSKMMTIIAKQLAEKPVFIRVASSSTLTKNFEIKVENPALKAVTITDFATQQTKKGIACEWTTTSEIDSFQTHLFHSSDGIYFTNISSEEGQNHSTRKQHYFIDEYPQKGENFYKLVLVLNNGEKFTVDEQLVIVDKVNKKIRINPKSARNGASSRSSKLTKTTPQG